MFARRPAALLPLALLALSGCSYVHFGPVPKPTTTVVGDAKLMQENADLRTEKKILQQELALTRAQGEALRSALENRAADGDTSRRLVEKLNDTSRELAALRASYTQLQAARPGGGNDDAANLRAQLGATEEKLATSMRAYTELQSEITRLRSEVSQVRDENLTLSQQVKTATAQNAEAQAALAQLNTELLAQRDARVRAEQDAETLRTERKTTAAGGSLAAQRTGAAPEARALNVDAAALKEELATTRSRVSALEDDRARLQRQLATTAQQLAAAVDRNPATAATSASAADVSPAAPFASPAARDRVVIANPVRVQLASAPVSTADGAAPNSTVADTAAAKAPAGATAAGAAPNAPRNSAAERGTSSVSANLSTSISSGKGGAVAWPELAAAGNARTHVVSAGDTLAKISQRYYGTPSRWSDILNANRDVLGEHNNLVVGRTLRIP